VPCLSRAQKLTIGPYENSLPSSIGLVTKLLMSLAVNVFVVDVSYCARNWMGKVGLSVNNIKS